MLLKYLGSLLQALESGAGAMSDAGMLNMLAIDALHGFKNPELWKTGLKNDVIRQAAYTADQKVRKGQQY